MRKRERKPPAAEEDALDILADGLPDAEGFKAEIREKLMRWRERYPPPAELDEDETKELALDRLAELMADPAAAEARIRAVIVDDYAQAGMPIPEWFRGPAAKAFLADLGVVIRVAKLKREAWPILVVAFDLEPSTSLGIGAF